MNDIASPFQLSLLIALLATVAVSLVGITIGYVIARFKFWGRDLLDAFCTLPLVLPPTVVGFYLLQVFGKKGWIGQHIYAATGWTPLFTWQAAVIASFVIALPIMVKTSRAAIEAVDQTFERVAYTLGKTQRETFLTVTLPLASKGLLAGVALSFARALGEFGATMMVAGNIPGKTQTMPLAIYQATQTGENGLATIMVLMLTASSFLVLFVINRLGARW